MHGAGGGAPAGNKNAQKHGRFAVEMIEAARYVRAMARQARELVEAVDCRE